MVRAFNLRLRAGGEQYWTFPESHVPRFPKLPNRNPYQEFFLAWDLGEVRGGYLLTHSRFAIRGESTWIACGAQLNMSEGIVNRAYGITGALNVRDALKRQPLLYGLGIGGFEEPQAKLLAAMDGLCVLSRFSLGTESIALLRQHCLPAQKSRDTTHVAGGTVHRPGMGGSTDCTFPARQKGRLNLTGTILRFRPWADELWNKCKGSYFL